MKWYQKTWGIILMIVLFFPAGLYLLWKHGRCSKKTKWIITILLLFISVVSSSVDINNSTSTTNNSEVVEASSSDNNESAEKSEEIKESESTEENTNIEELKTDNNSKSKADSKIKSGTYKIGTDIPAGEYSVISDDENIPAYIEVSNDSRHSLFNISANDNFTGNKYITVEDGQYLKLQRCKIQK